VEVLVGVAVLLVLLGLQILVVAVVVALNSLVAQVGLA
jgi:hypothetical protein